MAVNTNHPSNMALTIWQNRQYAASTT